MLLSGRLKLHGAAYRACMHTARALSTLVPFVALAFVASSQVLL